MIKLRFLLFSLALCLLIACNQGPETSEVSTEPTETPPGPTAVIAEVKATDTATPAPTSTATLEPTATSTIEPTATVTLMPTDTPEPVVEAGCVGCHNDQEQLILTASPVEEKESESSGEG